MTSESGSTFWSGAFGAGANRVQVIAADTVGNMANLTSSVSVDSTAPEFGQFGPTVWVKSQTVFAVAVAEAESGTLTATVNYAVRASGAGQMGPWTAAASFLGGQAATWAVGAGNVGVMYEATDAVGNARVSVEYSVWIDGTSPVLSNFLPLGTSWVPQQAKANVTVTAGTGRARGWLMRSGG